MVPQWRETSIHPLSSTFCNTWSGWNIIGLAASPLDLLRSTRSLWSWPIEVVNYRRATINCLQCAVQTCLYLLGPQCCLGTRQQRVCVCVCVYLLCCRIGVLGSLCNLARRQLQLAKKKEQRMKTKWRRQVLSQCFHIAMFYIFAKTGEQRMSTTLTTVWLTGSLEKTVKEGEVALHLLMQHSSPVTFTI